MNKTPKKQQDQKKEQPFVVGEENMKKISKKDKDSKTLTKTDRRKKLKSKLEEIESTVDGYDLSDKYVNTVGKALYQLSAFM